MAQHKSAEKRIRRNARRQDINTARKSSIRTALKKVDAAAQGTSEATTALNKATSALQKGVAKGLIHKNTAARKLSRLVKKTKTTTAKPAAAAAKKKAK